MANRHRVYETFVGLYPVGFRRAYGDELVQHFADLVADRGARAAWARTSLDLAITLPRYHLERIMTDRHSTALLNVVIALLVAGGLAVMVVDVASAGLFLFVAAGALAITQRGSLGRSLRVPDSDRRRSRLRTAAALGAIFVTTFTAYLLTVGDTWSASDTILMLIGTPAMFGAVAYLVAGLLTSPSPPGDLADAR